MWLVVGLGNPGKRYEGTRHNIGFVVVQRLAARMGIRCDSAQLGALVGNGVLGDEKLLLAQPQSFMNRSGLPVRSLQGYYKVPVGQLVVVHDDVDLPFGTLRVKIGGGHGGHNGLRDLNKHLAEADYLRVRFGVGRPPEGWDTADYVLGSWSPPQLETLDALVDQAADAAQHLVERGVRSAMNTFNVRIKAAPASASSDERPSSPTVVTAGGAT